MAEIDQLVQQLVEMQSQMAFHEDTVRALNDALAQQQQEIIILRRQLELLKQRQEEQASGSDQRALSATDERPPHY
ncbi:MAG: SlyX family protein [Halieaceae bacterium]|nr:SlyX family protein [Halieaceae bacterium]